jgi:hypothetical protein
MSDWWFIWGLVSVRAALPLLGSQSLVPENRQKHWNVWLALEEEFCILQICHSGFTLAFEIETCTLYPFDFKQMYIGRNCCDIRQRVPGLKSKII